MYHIRIVLRKIFLNSRGYSNYSQSKHPFYRTVNAITNDIKGIFKKDDPSSSKPQEYVSHTDVVVIGGGIIGTSVAYWLKTRTGRGLDVVVIDNDKGNSLATCTSFGGLHSQYTLPENILLSQFTGEFLRNTSEYLYADFDAKFSPHGYLMLASEGRGEEFEKNIMIQKELGAKSILLTPDRIKRNYPWINTDGVVLGCISSESEGWFDPNALKEALKFKAQEMGVRYLKAEAVDFYHQPQQDVFMEGVTPGTYKRLTKVYYKMPNGEDRELEFSICVLAAGAGSQKLATQIGIGTKRGMLQVPLPVVSKKCNIYYFQSNKLGLNTPIMMDTSGTWLKRNGLSNSFICGKAPLNKAEWQEDDVKDVEHIKNDVITSLAHRIPAFNDINIENHWTEKYDYTYYDESGIIGPHMYHNNLYFATGFGNQGIQHAPGIGRAIAEHIVDGSYSSIDLTRFEFDRFLTNDPLLEYTVF